MKTVHIFLALGVLMAVAPLMSGDQKELSTQQKERAIRLAFGFTPRFSQKDIENADRTSYTVSADTFTTLRSISLSVIDSQRGKLPSMEWCMKNELQAKKIITHAQTFLTQTQQIITAMPVSRLEDATVNVTEQDILRCVQWAYIESCDRHNAVMLFFPGGIIVRARHDNIARIILNALQKTAGNNAVEPKKSMVSQ